MKTYDIGKDKNSVIRVHFIISGQVQGVGFRWRAARMAKSMGISGWVRNLRDGSVELEVQGRAGDIESFIDALGGCAWIEFDRVRSNIIPLKDEHDFRITGY